MYADDSKVIAESGQGLQEDIGRIKEWCNKWSMKLNSQKCEIMYFGKGNPGRTYYIDGEGERVILEGTEEEKDLGVIISNNGKNNRQAEKAISKANSQLGRMRRTFKFFNIKLFKIIYPTFIRPHLEFASPVWNSISKGNIKKLENIQRRATKMVIELSNLGYEERLKKLGLTTLETRRKTADLIQIYKIKNKIEIVDINIPENPGNYQGRRHRHQIRKELGGNIPMRDNALLNRSTTTWNMLPSNIVETETVTAFKQGLSEHIRVDALRRSVYRN